MFLLPTGGPALPDALPVMQMHELAESISASYDAAANAALPGGGGTTWQQVGEQLCRALGAQTAALWIQHPHQDAPDILCATGLAARDAPDYIRQFRNSAAWMTASSTGSTAAGEAAPPRAWLGEALLADPAFRRADLYRKLGQEHGLARLLGTLAPLGAPGGGVLGASLRRSAEMPAFAERDRTAFEGALRHIRHALQLGYRLRAMLRPACAAQAALDALPFGAVVVDAELRVIHANAAAETLLKGGAGPRGAGGGLLRTAGPGADDATTFMPKRRAEATEFQMLVQAAANGGDPGGGLRLSTGDGADRMLVAIVAPLPLADPQADPAAPTEAATKGAALVVLRDMAAPAAVNPVLLIDLFNLTAAEAEVAVALANGRSAEDVANARSLSPATVRAQIRSILTKTGAPGLRGLERLIASLPGG